MPACKWCISFKVKHEGFGRTLNTKFSCANPKGLFDAQSDSSCEAWELDEERAAEHERRSTDELDQQDTLRHGFY